ncbi:MAG: hypothetical protein WBV11_04030 [Salegentibacter sp.]
MEFVFYFIAAALIGFVTYLWLKTLRNNRKQEKCLQREVEEIRQIQKHESRKPTAL